MSSEIPLQRTTIAALYRESVASFQKLSIALCMASKDSEAKGSEQINAEPRAAENQTVDSDIDDEIRSTTPLKEAVKEIGNVITCLYRLSITIQSPASQDRLERMDMSHLERFDIEHLSNKYQLGADYQYLIERLGKANIKRRQLLKYHNEHHEMMSTSIQKKEASGEEHYSCGKRKVAKKF
jgi:hypothetical protein